MFTFRPAETSAEALARYVSLFRACFPGATHLDSTYLHWLYALNPAGAVVGMDAMAGDVLAAHYVCVPAHIWLFGKKVNALLSLNTATHPDFQGKGLFTALAEKTYALGASQGAAAVFGVANANSTPGFLRKLGFQLIAPLDARVGLGRPISVNWDKVSSSSDFRRAWTPDELAWRMESPANRVHATALTPSGSGLFAPTDHRGIMVWGETDISLAPDRLKSSPTLARLFLGLYPAGTYRNNLSTAIPSRFRPSPLNLIYRSIAGPASSLDASRICFNFFDFDAY